MSNSRPFNIRIFVAGDLPDGLRYIEKSNWIGSGIICSLGYYANVKNRSSR